MAAEKGTTWDEGVEMPEYGPLVAPVTADVVVIGAGLTGLVTAYLLARAGKNVVVLEKRGAIGRGATGLTTAFLTQVVDTAIEDLRDMFGDDGAALILRSHQEAIDAVERISKEEGIDCEFSRCSNFSYANDDREREGLLAEARAAKGMPIDLSFHDDARLGIPNRGYLEIRNQAKFHPLKYLSGLAAAATKRGARIYTKSEAGEPEGDGPYLVPVGPHIVTAKKVVVATYGPIGKRLYFKKAFYESYVMELDMPTGKVLEGIYEDNRDPYHYFRVDRSGDRDRVVIGGEDHRSDIPLDESKGFQALAAYAERVFDGVPYTVTRRWRGPIIEPVDGLAYIGTHKDRNVFYATGFSGNGMTYAHIAATIIADGILRKVNPYARVYAASRRPTLEQLLRKGRDYARELMEGAVKNSLKYRKKEE